MMSSGLRVNTLLSWYRASWDEGWKCRRGPMDGVGALLEPARASALAFVYLADNQRRAQQRERDRRWAGRSRGKSEPQSISVAPCRHLLIY
jgi:hypothetical protein